MKKFIYVRNSLDWHKISNIEEFIKANVNCRDLLKIWMPKIIDFIEKWNNEFPISYFKFRAKMKDITLESIKNINDISVINKSKEYMLKDDYLLYIIDDDDWVAPNIFDEIQKQLKEQDDIFVWRFGYLDKQFKITDWDQKIDNIKWSYSNNCVVTNKGYQKLKYWCKKCDFLEDHRKMDVFIQKHPFEINVMKNVLSVYNQSPASATKIWDFTKNSSNIKNLFNEYEICPILPQEVNWALPYIIKMWDLIKKNKNKIKNKIYI